MLQHRFTGPGTQDFLTSLCPSSLSSLLPFTSTLSVILNASGGIIDDTIITKQEDASHFYVVTNAGRAKEDVAWIGERLDEWKKSGKAQVEWERLDGWGLVALQGPKAGEVLQRLTEADLSTLKFGKATFADIGENKVKCHIARGGYTGEDGFEVSDASDVGGARAVGLMP
jgi:aminomethyltransferase